MDRRNLFTPEGVVGSAGLLRSRIMKPDEGLHERENGTERQKEGRGAEGGAKVTTPPPSPPGPTPPVPNEAGTRGGRAAGSNPG